MFEIGRDRFVAVFCEMNSAPRLLDFLGVARTVIYTVDFLFGEGAWRC
jgi:hypothetical protein